MLQPRIPLPEGPGPDLLWQVTTLGADGRRHFIRLQGIGQTAVLAIAEAMHGPLQYCAAVRIPTAPVACSVRPTWRL